MVRVDQAGEYGATRIYAGQLAVLRRNCPEAKLVARMAAQEERHLARFNALMSERRVRPTALQPLWNLAGFALGAATALISEEAALACTDAVETEIDRHYARQLRDIGEEDPELGRRRPGVPGRGIGASRSGTGQRGAKRHWLPCAHRRDPRRMPRRHRAF